MNTTHHKHCDHIGLFTGNTGRLCAFYITKLGFQQVKKETLSRELVQQIFGLSAECAFTRLVLDGILLEIFELLLKTDDVPVRHHRGYHHWGLSVGDREGFIEEMKKKDVETRAVTRNAHTVYFIKDPDGNMIEIRT